MRRLALFFEMGAATRTAQKERSNLPQLGQPLMAIHAKNAMTAVTAALDLMPTTALPVEQAMSSLAVNANQQHVLDPWQTPLECVYPFSLYHGQNQN